MGWSEADRRRGGGREGPSLGVRGDLINDPGGRGPESGGQKKLLAVAKSQSGCCREDDRMGGGNGVHGECGWGGGCFMCPK